MFVGFVLYHQLHYYGLIEKAYENILHCVESFSVQ
jgi:hypothetical protein